MPDAFSGGGIQRQQAVGEQVVAGAVGAVEIAGGAAGGDVDDAALEIDRHAGPVVGGAGVGPRVLGPGIVAELTGARDGVELPTKLAGAGVVGANVAVRGGKGFALAPADDQQVLVDNAGAGEAHGLLFGVAIQVHVEVDAALVAEAGEKFAGFGVERIDV